MTKGVAVIRTSLALGMLCAIAALQYTFDSHKLREVPEPQSTWSPLVVEAADLGLHSAVASFLWTDTITELPLLKEGAEKFKNDLALINALDPKFSFPYAFSMMVLPYTTRYPDRINAAIEIGKRGIEQADPDWRIPFYLATIYHLELKDTVQAAHYFDITAHTPNVPFATKRFSLNYGILPTVREQTKQIWSAIYENSNDTETRERAKAYVTRLEMLDLLEEAAMRYKSIRGAYPAALNDLIEAHVLTSVPVDPLGFELVIDTKTGIAGIKK